MTTKGDGLGGGSGNDFDLDPAVRRHAADALGLCRLVALHHRVGLAPAAGMDEVGGHATAHQVAAHGLRAALRQGDVAGGAADGIRIADGVDALGRGLPKLFGQAVELIAAGGLDVLQAALAESEQRIALQGELAGAAQGGQRRGGKRAGHGSGLGLVAPAAGAGPGLPVERACHAFQIEQHLELARLHTVVGLVEVEHVIPLAHHGQAFAEMRRAQQGLDLRFVESGFHQLQLGFGHKHAALAHLAGRDVGKADFTGPRTVVGDGAADRTGTGREQKHQGGGTGKSPARGPDRLASQAEWGVLQRHGAYPFAYHWKPTPAPAVGLERVLTDVLALTTQLPFSEILETPTATADSPL